MRRLYFDLLGVPPELNELDEMAGHWSETAWEALVDRLLADPRYGEHWARHWLDLVRYAESDGWNQDAYRKHIWRYRDYVVEAFNRDKPYPLFVREQLAGDEIPGEGRSLAATGFLRLGIYEYNQRDAKSHWNDIMNEITDVTGDVFLGLGMACARCHDHKFDPLPQRDYFKLRAFFEPLVWRDDLKLANDQQRQAHAEQLARWETATVEIRGQIDALLEPYYDRKWRSTVAKFPLDIQACYHKPLGERDSWEQQMAYLVERQFYEEGGGPLKSLSKQDAQRHAALQEQLAKYDHLKPTGLPSVMAVTDFAGRPAPTRIPDAPDKAPIAPGFLTVLTPSGRETVAATDDGGPIDALSQAAPASPSSATATTGRRTRLAEWIGSDTNPLTPRVIVNRVWQQHFGQGLAPTANDFGHLGQPPTHPELLDWLTLRFIEDGWSIKKLHRRILTTDVWRQASQHPDAQRQQRIDPGEQLLWRARVRRLAAEQIRDAMLAVSGELQPTLGGPSVAASVPRRSLYVKTLRNTPEPLLQAFDQANGLKSVSQRNTTTTPMQSLLMFNGDYVLNPEPQRWARRLLADPPDTAQEVVARAMWMAWGRAPTGAELAESLRFLAADPSAPGADLSLDRVTDLCHILLNSGEFQYID